MVTGVEIESQAKSPVDTPNHRNTFTTYSRRAYGVSPIRLKCAAIPGAGQTVVSDITCPRHGRDRLASPFLFLHQVGTTLSATNVVLHH
jgi:hypothetical protein